MDLIMLVLFPVIVPLDGLLVCLLRITEWAISTTTTTTTTTIQMKRKMSEMRRGSGVGGRGG